MKIRVLVVDDDKDVARITSRLLNREADIDVTVTTAPAVAIKQARLESYDVVVSDVMMPGMSGMDLIKTLRVFDLDIPVILVTGAPSLEVAQEAVELGAFRYLAKPVDHDELILVVRQAAMEHKLALLKRQASQALGRAHLAPGDWIGMTQAFESAIKSMQLAHQPILKALDGSIVGYEAFIRTGSDRLPTPGSLIDAGKELGRLGEVTKAVVEKSILTAKETDATLFLNMLPDEIVDPGFSKHIDALSGLNVTLELSDFERFESVPNFEATIHEIRNRHIEIAIDDFGVGRAGLGSFVLLTPLFAKIEMSLIFSIDSDLSKRSVVSGLIDICHAENIVVIAEGIETAEEMATCIELGCDLLQGHYIAEPDFGLPVPDFSLPDYF